MTVLKVTTYPETVLAKVAQPLTRFGPEEQKLFDDMIETIHDEEGVGIAAPQVGISKRIFIACPTVKEGEEYVIVNPEILEESGRQCVAEGCLSLPGGFSAEVPRAKKVRFRYQDRHGKSQEMTVTDFFARIIQHENDHINGKLFIDRIDFNTRQELLAQYHSA